MNKKELKRVMSGLGKLSHKKSPRSKEYYEELQRKSIEARRRKMKEKKLSTPND